MSRARFITVLLVAATLVLTASAVPFTGQSGYAQNTCQTFKETGRTVCGRFLQYWQEHGGLAQQGFPISEPLQEVSETDGKPYTVQYFERAVFEMHPEHAAPNDVLLSLLGVFHYKQKYPNGAPNQKASTEAGAVKFSETGHTLGGKFLAYWKSHGGLAQQGFPISDEFTEVSDLNGQPYTVQYFERAVFESHPENQPPYEVLLSQLGTFRYREKYQQAAGTASPISSGPTPTPQSLGPSPTPVPTAATGGTIPPQPSGETAELVMQVTNEQMVSPWGLAVDGAGNIYVTARDIVLKFDSAGKLLTTFGSPGTGDGQFNFKCYNNPVYNCGAVAVDTAGNVYLADSGNSRLQKFDRDGHFLAVYGVKGEAEGQMLNPIDVAVDSQGNIYIVDDVNTGVRKYDKDGHFVAKLAAGSNWPAIVREPVGMGVDRNDNVYVVDDKLSAAFKFSKDGQLVQRWGRAGQRAGEFNYASDVATDPQGNVYVLELAPNARVQKFTSSGAWMMSWGKYGQGPGEFQSPSSIAVDAQGFVYVLETDSGRLQKFHIK